MKVSLQSVEFVSNETTICRTPTLLYSLLISQQYLKWSRLASYKLRLRYTYQIPSDVTNVKNMVIMKTDALEAKYVADAATPPTGSQSAKPLRIA